MADDRMGEAADRVLIEVGDTLARAGEVFARLLAALGQFAEDRAVRMAITERCEVTELLVDQCGCRRHRNSPDPLKVEHVATHWFAADYPGRCMDCDAVIEPGDLIGATGEGYLCSRHRSRTPEGT